ncbi:MAG: ABC transporter permease [Sphingomonadaceae bacterium]
MSIAAARSLETPALPRRQASLWGDAWQRLISNRMAVLGGIVVIALLLIALFADLIAPYSPTKQDYAAIFQPPGGKYILGTDNLGRDQLSRLIHGARVAVAAGIFSQLVIVAIGVPIGAIAALAGGKIDNLLMRFTDIVYAFPDLLLIILLSTALREHPLRSIGGGLLIIFFAIGVVNWVNLARLTRGQILSLKERDFVEAARALGARNHDIIWNHLIPNALGPIIVSVTFGIPHAIFTEATLSFLGLGITPPNPSWGSMIQDGYQAIFAYPHLVLFPAVAIAVTLLAFTFLGDGLRDALDPRMK